MRKLAILLSAIAASWIFGQEPSFARYQGPWCLHVTIARDSITSRCDMPSYEACRAEMRSMGGTYCTQNPYYWWNRTAEPPRRKIKRRVKRHR